MPTSSTGFQPLLDGLKVEPTSDTTFIAPVVARNLPKMFGGQIVAQALMAAGATIPTERTPHSLHAYFLAPGDPTQHVDMRVEIIRDGGAFSLRGVRATQGDHTIFCMNTSFHRREDGPRHNTTARPPVGPDGAEIVQAWLGPEEELPEWWDTNGPIEVRFIDRPVGLVGGEPADPTLRMWQRPRSEVRLDALTSAAALAYASDLNLLDASLHPHAVAWYGEDPIFGASIDHAMWFHADLAWADWLYCEVVSPVAGEGRAFAHATYRDRDGLVVASVAQEGALRKPRSIPRSD